MLKTIAIHLPQFHPIPENDAWWGKGFTEWTNVAKAKPLFDGHYQPHIPADLGFYDLRLEESRVAQAALAQEYGIDGFCYYHYWFNGKRLLNRPLDDMLRSKKPDFPFMLCWANENWSRRWDGDDRQVLMRQDYSAEDDRQHIRFLIEHFFSDPRYIRVDGKPFFLIYRPQLFPDIRRTIELWRGQAKETGAGDLYIGYMQSFGFREAPEKFGFDCAVEFEPDFGLAQTLRKKPSIINRVLNRLGKRQPAMQNTILSYGDYVALKLGDTAKSPSTFKSVSPMWDNSPRRKRDAVIFQGSTPELYGQWLRHAAKVAMASRQTNQFLFINAWNEWAEGNHLEPCQRWGRKYLESTLSAIESIRDQQTEKITQR